MQTAGFFSIEMCFSSHSPVQQSYTGIDHYAYMRVANV